MMKRAKGGALNRKEAAAARDATVKLPSVIDFFEAVEPSVGRPCPNH